MRPQKLFRLVAMLAAVMAGHDGWAQMVPGSISNGSSPALPSGSRGGAAGSAAAVGGLPPRPVSVIIDVGSGRLIDLPGPAATILAADPRIARVQPASPTTIFIMGVAAGHTTVIATTEAGAEIAQYDVIIRASGNVLGTGTGAPTTEPPPTAIAVSGAIRRSLPGMSQIHVAMAGKDSYILSGTVANASEAQRAEAIARAFVGNNREVINNFELLSSTQVNVRVRVAEISRQITRELGFNWQAMAQVGSFLIGLRSGPAAGTVANAVAGGISSGLLGSTASRFAAGVVTGRLDINSVIDALAGDNLITILAEPNLTAQSGETASFLAGGEFPIPVGGNSANGSTTVTIEFKQFGVSLAFVPTVLGPNRLNLRIRPEVSELSTTGAVSLPLATGSITIPALQVRRAETTVELGSGQSFAIAGLLQRSTTQIDSGVLGLGDVPIIGPLFRSDQFQRNETELVIIVTPYLVQPVSDPSKLTAPTDGFRPATDLERVINQRQIARGSLTPQLRSRPDAGFLVE